ncbi:hypothetical protein P7C73_g5571, partial [Tremellales sp. Uapishka_1]
MGKWAAAEYDRVVVEKLRILFERTNDEPGPSNRRGFREFVKGLDPEDKKIQAAFRTLRQYTHPKKASTFQFTRTGTLVQEDRPLIRSRSYPNWESWEARPTLSNLRRAREEVDEEEERAQRRRRDRRRDGIVFEVDTPTEVDEDPIAIFQSPLMQADDPDPWAPSSNEFNEVVRNFAFGSSDREAMPDAGRISAIQPPATYPLDLTYSTSAAPELLRLESTTRQQAPVRRNPPTAYQDIGYPSFDVLPLSATSRRPIGGANPARQALDQDYLSRLGIYCVMVSRLHTILPKFAREILPDDAPVSHQTSIDGARFGRIMRDTRDLQTTLSILLRLMPIFEPGEWHLPRPLPSPLCDEVPAEVSRLPLFQIPTEEAEQSEPVSRGIKVFYQNVYDYACGPIERAFRTKLTDDTLLYLEDEAERLKSVVTRQMTPELARVFEDEEASTRWGGEIV